MKLLTYFLLSFPLFTISQTLIPSTNIEITKYWYQEEQGYTYPMTIFVPEDDVPEGGFPVCILLHGNGGNSGSIINQFKNILNCHILVAPSGYSKSWNICDEGSDAPDVEMVDELINQVQTYSNVNPNKIRILGSSNGAGLANNILIQNKNSGVDIVCAIVSHLNEPQYHLGNFHKPNALTDPLSSFCGYDNVVNPLATRKYLSISNDNDPVIPYAGGTSVVGVDFLPAETAAFYIAENNGFTGSQLTSGTTMGSPQVTEYSYLSGAVVHIKGDAGHSTNVTQREYIKSYFSDCEVTLGINDYKPNKVKVYPNPTNSIITVTGFSDQVNQYSVFNILGQQVLSGSITSKITHIDLSELVSNIYFLKINDQVIKIIRK